MNRILLAGTALLTLISAGMPASAAHKHAARYRQAPVQQQWFGSGARIDEVDSNSPAARAGMRPGDRIVGINGRPINGISDVIPFVEGGGRSITFDIERGGTRMQVRASPPNGRWQRGVLGITGMEYRHDRNGGSDYVEPPPYVAPAPTAPDPVIILPNNNN
jgi:membrane-associated protease RseP (regulator of RpoE activity)